MHGGEDVFEKRCADQAYEGRAPGCGFSREDEEEGALMDIHVRCGLSTKRCAREGHQKKTISDPGGLMGWLWPSNVKDETENASQLRARKR